MEIQLACQNKINAKTKLKGKVIFSAEIIVPLILQAVIACS